MPHHQMYRIYLIPSDEANVLSMDIMRSEAAKNPYYFKDSSPRIKESAPISPLPSDDFYEIDEDKIRDVIFDFIDHAKKHEPATPPTMDLMPPIYEDDSIAVSYSSNIDLKIEEISKKHDVPLFWGMMLVNEFVKEGAIQANCIKNIGKRSKIFVQGQRKDEMIGGFDFNFGKLIDEYGTINKSAIKVLDIQGIEARVKRSPHLHLPIASFTVIQMWNFYCSNEYPNALESTAKKLNISEDTVWEIISDFILEEKSDHVFDQHCKEILQCHTSFVRQEMRHHYGLGVKGFVLSVAKDFNLAIPLCTCWVECLKYDFQWYCSNIFWPKVYASLENFALSSPRAEGMENYGFQHDIRNYTPESIVNVFCRTCIFKPNSTAKQFETVGSLRRHHADVHAPDYEFLDGSDDDTEDESEYELERWSFKKCPDCEKICLTQKSYDFHVEMAKDQEKYISQNYQK